MSGQKKIAKKPASKKAGARKPAAKKVVEKAGAKKPAAEKPAAKKVVKKAGAKKVAKKPAAKKVVKKAGAKKVAKKAGAKKPAAKRVVKKVGGRRVAVKRVARRSHPFVSAVTIRKMIKHTDPKMRISAKAVKAIQADAVRLVSEICKGVKLADGKKIVMGTDIAAVAKTPAQKKAVQAGIKSKRVRYGMRSAAARRALKKFRPGLKVSKKAAGALAIAVNYHLDCIIAHANKITKAKKRPAGTKAMLTEKSVIAALKLVKC